MLSRYSGAVIGARCAAGLAVLGALAALLVPAPARAETSGAAPPAGQRPWHASVLAGGYFALSGPADLGAQVVATVSPGGAVERFGVRASARSYEDRSDGFFTLGVTFEAAASRPRLVLSLFAEAGLSNDENVITGAGIHTTLAIIGPFALGTDAAAHVIWDGVDTTMALTGSGMLGLVF